MFFPTCMIIQEVKVGSSVATYSGHIFRNCSIANVTEWLQFNHPCIFSLDNSPVHLSMSRLLRSNLLRFFVSKLLPSRLLPRNLLKFFFAKLSSLSKLLWGTYSHLQLDYYRINGHFWCAFNQQLFTDVRQLLQNQKIKKVHCSVKIQPHMWVGYSE